MDGPTQLFTMLFKMYTISNLGFKLVSNSLKSFENRTHKKFSFEIL